MTRMLLLGTFSLALMGCAEPFIVVSGGELSGEVTDAPSDWSAVRDVQVIQIETRPDDPYSVNIWMAVVGPDLYIATGENDTNWTEHLAENRDTRARIDGVIYELEASAVTQSAEHERVVVEYVRKYDDLEMGDNWVMRGQVFRLDRR